MNPVKCGASIRHADMPDNIGTLGCIVQSRSSPKQRYLLTAAHVINRGGYARNGDAIEAETPNGWVKIAEFERAVRLHDAPDAVQACDAAIARILDSAPVSADIDGFGAPPGGLATGVWSGMELRFRGAGSPGVVSARLESTGNSVPVIYEDFLDGGTFELRLDNQIVYGKSSAAWSTASQPGDSGALVMDRNGLAVGLHVGRTPPGYEINASVCTPLEVVLQALDVELPPAAASAPAAAPPAAPPPPPPTGTVRTLLAPPPGANDDNADDAFGQRAFAEFKLLMRSQLAPHNIFGGVQWRLTPDGVEVGGAVTGTGGKLVTVPRVWNSFSAPILAAANRYNVPIELIIATICTESGGNAAAMRQEPGWTSDAATPGRVSAGLMQTLLTTARNATGNPALARDSLLDAGISIQAGTAYIDQQRAKTSFDPPVVACAYNAGDKYLEPSPGNRWRMRQYPIGTGNHADRFVQWFNDSFSFLGATPGALPDGTPSLWALFRS